MRKITDFIINKRHTIIGIFLILTIISAIFMTKVQINGDMTKYLPETSETRIGTELMYKEFEDADKISELKLMIKNISEEEKINIHEKLKNIKGVSSVSYDETENYNKNEYTLYIINVDDKSDSELSKTIYDKIKEDYENYEIYTSGSISYSNNPILPTWILISSVLCALVILIIMCDSYLEPFLFLITILIAVVLNGGTNIIFDNVSEVTNSISAILQMALSMDYSIMLMSRYREERLSEKDDIKAMKNALYHSFQSISSSSLTTIVGLLALVFMSFTIGRDLGLVLAKGVFLSLISIFFCLPTLILTFDKLITKTEKKTINLKLNHLGLFSNKFKYPITILFIILFVGSFFLKGNLGILYTSGEIDKINEIFPSDNQMALIYNNKDEENIEKYLKEIESKNKVKSVMGYGNTLNEKLNYQLLNEKISSMGGNLNLENDLLKMLYYHYYNSEEKNVIRLDELYNFITNEASQNLINLDNTLDIKKLKNFVYYNEITKKRSPQEISNILNLEEKNINNILILFNKDNNLELTLNEFIKFIKNDVLTNEEFSNIFDESTINQINKLEVFTDKNILTKNLNIEELSTILSIDKNIISDLLLLKYMQLESNSEITIEEFINYSLSLNNDEKLLYLQNFTKKDYINNNITDDELIFIFTQELFDVVNPFLTNKTITEFVKLIPENIIEGNKNLKLIKTIVEETNKDTKEKFNIKNISDLFSIEKEKVNKVFVIYDYKNNKDNWTSTISEVIKLILANIDSPEISNIITPSQKIELITLNNIIENTLSDTKINSEKLSEILKIEKDNVDLLYSIYITKYIDNEISLKTLVDFLINDLLQKDEYKDLINTNDINNLYSINRIMNYSLNYKKLTKEEMYNTLSALTNELDSKSIDLLYIYYGSVNEYDESWELTLEKLVNYLNENIIEDERFKTFINEENKEEIKANKKSMDKSKMLLVGENYNRLIIKTTLEQETEETYNFIEDIKSLFKSDVKEFYIVGDSPMSYEMSKTFGSEFDFISILTMIFLFIVVAVTFRSLIIPIILVLLIQCAVYLTMGILSLTVGSTYFIALLVVQSILMGATIDYAILYSSYYLEYRKSNNIKETIIKSYNSSIHTILTSSSILIIVTFMLGIFAQDLTSKICITIAEGTLCSVILILILLPGTLSTFDKIITKKDK